MTKITLNDSMMGATMKICDGNPGAMQALMSLQTEVINIDPKGSIGGFAPMLLLDTFGIYGSDIYILFNDKCNSEPDTMWALLKATQMGIIKQSKLKEMAADQCRQINLSESEWERVKMVEFA